MTATVAELVAEAKASTENLSAAQVTQELIRGVLIVDLREPTELADGMIEGAVHAPRGMLEFYADPASPYHRPEFDPTQRTILYCASGGRSALAARSLAALGYADVAHLDGGFKAWVGAGGPIATGAS